MKPFHDMDLSPKLSTGWLEQPQWLKKPPKALWKAISNPESTTLRNRDTLGCQASVVAYHYDTDQVPATLAEHHQWPTVPHRYRWVDLHLQDHPWMRAWSWLHPNSTHQVHQAFQALGADLMGLWLFEPAKQPQRSSWLWLDHPTLWVRASVVSNSEAQVLLIEQCHDHPLWQHD